MVAIAFIGTIQHEVGKDSIHKLVDRIKTMAACSTIVVCNANGLFATATKLNEQLEVLFDSGIDLVMVGEQAISRNCCRSVFAKAEWPIIKALNLPGSSEENSTRCICQEGIDFWFVSSVDGTSKLPVEHSYVKLDEFFRNKKAGSFVIINESGLDSRYLQAIAWKYSGLGCTLLVFGSGAGIATKGSLINGDGCFLQCDIGSVACENSIFGLDPEQWWRKNIERRPINLIPKWGTLKCDYSIVWLDKDGIKKFITESVRI